jgi:hypothetical protein
VLDASSKTTALGGLARPVRELNEITPASCKHLDWDDIDSYVKQVRPPHGMRKLDPAQVARGRDLFTGEGGCSKCHSGAGWTLSRRFYTPSGAKNTELATTATFAKPAAWPAVWTFHDGGKQIEPQPAAADPGHGDPAAGDKNVPPQMSCVLRNVATFGVPGDDAATTALERKPPKAGATDVQRAQGKGGYNIPSLYGLTLGAPFLHHGQAATLDALLADSKWNAHTTAGAANFSPSADDRAALAAFLQTIDDTIEEVSAPAGQDGCPAQ